MVINNHYLLATEGSAESIHGYSFKKKMRAVLSTFMAINNNYFLETEGSVESIHGHSFIKKTVTRKSIHQIIVITI